MLIYRNDGWRIVFRQSAENAGYLVVFGASETPLASSASGMRSNCLVDNVMETVGELLQQEDRGRGG